MFKNISYRKKLKALWVGSIIMLFICYRFSISKTIEQYKVYNNSAISETNNDETSTLENLKLKNKTLDETLAKFVLDTADNSKNLVGIIAPLCAQNNLVLKEYKPAPAAQIDSLKILTRSVSLQGKFIDCLKLVYNLETQANAGRISSLLFKSYTNPSDSKTNLVCTIYVQNIITNTDEKN
jgi:hypothetical protein